jgi:hypothetical protein
MDERRCQCNEGLVIDIGHLVVEAHSRTGLRPQWEQKQSANAASLSRKAQRGPGRKFCGSCIFRRMASWCVCKHTIQQVTSNGQMHPASAGPITELLRSIDGCESLDISVRSSSTVRNKKSWRALRRKRSDL